MFVPPLQVAASPLANAGCSDTASAFKLPQTSQTYQVTIDRRQIERALIAIGTPDGYEASPICLACRPNGMTLSRSWDGMQLSTSIKLNSARNNLPRDGLTFEALEPFGTLGGNGRLTLGYPQSVSRRVELAINPGANQAIVEVNDAALSVPISFAASDTAAKPPTRAMRLRLALSWIEPVSVDKTATGSVEAPRPTIRRTCVKSELISAQSTNYNHGTITELSLAELRQVLTHPGDLLNRSPLPDVHASFDSSEMTCSFDEIETQSILPDEHGCVTYLVTKGNPFVSFGPGAAHSARDYLFEITTHGIAFELACLAQERSAQGDAIPALRPQAGRYTNAIDIRMPSAIVHWVQTTMGSEDRLVMGLARDGRVDVLLARGSETVTFIYPPTISGSVVPT